MVCYYSLKDDSAFLSAFKTSCFWSQYISFKYILLKMTFLWRYCRLYASCIIVLAVLIAFQTSRYLTLLILSWRLIASRRIFDTDQTTDLQHDSFKTVSEEFKITVSNFVFHTYLILQTRHTWSKFMLHTFVQRLHNSRIESAFLLQSFSDSWTKYEAFLRLLQLLLRLSTKDILCYTPCKQTSWGKIRTSA